MIGRARGPVGALLLLAACSGVREPFEGHVPTTTGHLFVRSQGEGPDIVMLHGLGDSGVGWRKITGPILEAGYRLTVPDALGAGRSTADAGADLSLAAHVQRLGELLEALGIERPVLVGNSLGGSVALLFAQQFPDRVRGLVLLDPAAYRTAVGGARWIWAFPDLSAAAMELLGPEVVAEMGLSFNFADWRRVTAEDLRVYTTEAARPGAFQAYVRQQAQVERDLEEAAAWEARHGSITCPTLILWGDGDPILPLAQAERLEAEVPHARLVVLEGVGHTPQLEAPERTVAEILEFLRGLDH